MEPGRMPPLFGKNWHPEHPLQFYRPLHKKGAREECLSFVSQQYPSYLSVVATVWDHQEKNAPDQFEGDSWHEFSRRFTEALGREAILQVTSHVEQMLQVEVIPRRSMQEHVERRLSYFLLDVRLMLRRLAHYMSVTIQQRMEWQRLMVRTRELDTALKTIFTEGIETPDGSTFGGKGFRSTWQEGVVAVGTALKRSIDSPRNATPSSGYEGDLVAPMIRDIGLSLAMGDTPLDVMAANLGKVGSNQNGGWADGGGRDLHIGAWHVGVLPPTAPLPIASSTMTGLAFAAWRKGQQRFHVACIGEGASSSGEFWEAMNFAGTRGLPITYILQNNQIALDTPSYNQSGVELWADKARAMGFPSWTIDGSDPAVWYASSALAREYALSGGGPTLIHVETMRGCGHAHHHDDLYLGNESGTPPGYVDRELLSYWEAKDPIPNHRSLLLQLGVKDEALQAIEKEEHEAVQQAHQSLLAMEWPQPETVTKGVTTIHDADTHDMHLARIQSDVPLATVEIELDELKYAPKGGWTYARAIQQAMVDIATYFGEDCVFIGEDMEVAGAFGMNMALKNAGFQHLLVDMPLSEAAIVHTGTGAALSGMRSMVEIQFGGFAALGFNALVNNAAMLRWRWGADCPMTVRIPLGARTRSGPFHANMIESWFSNDPGLVVLAPGTPQDAYDLLVEGAHLDDPVLFLEHIGLYGLRGGRTGWGMNINQVVDTESVKTALSKQARYKIGKAACIREGTDLTLVTWGAMVHIAQEVANVLQEDGHSIEIIDLRTLLPFDAQTCVSSVFKTGRLAILHEAQWTGGLGHTIQSRILEECFFNLESKPVVIGALDTPVPFSPPLENHTIPSVEYITKVLQTLLGME
ncbi:MAG: thiamine pyrophosphate-dependent enzyme [archaeon]|nr:thiamine pyrophosphate-dependent enzyme [archaeon]MDA0843058.1 thiamine pyrophosphate-dependent enzyme [archaeon]MDA1167614.1 thiamine pyrophosphate-dependent enzyme [archaeon]